MGTTNMWDLIGAAGLEDARTLHLHIGRPPCIRREEGSLELLPGEWPELDSRAMLVMLSGMVDPDLWDHFEANGQGEVSLSRSGGGRPIRLTLFKSGGQWAAVVHL